MKINVYRHPTFGRISIPVQPSALYIAWDSLKTLDKAKLVFAGVGASIGSWFLAGLFRLVMIETLHTPWKVVTGLDWWSWFN